jgi:hypothetical protein
MESNKPSVEKTWKHIMTRIGKNYGTIKNQLTEVQKKYPEFAKAYIYMGGYIGFLTNRIRLHEIQIDRPDVSRPGLPEPEPPFISPADMICAGFGDAHWMCRCARGEIEQCGMDTGGDGDALLPGLPKVNCKELVKELNDSLGNICEIYQKYTSGNRYTNEDFENLKKYAQAMIGWITMLMEMGCYEAKYFVGPVVISMTPSQ